MKFSVGIILTLTLALAGTAWALKSSLEKAATAIQEADQLRESLTRQAEETRKANQRYLVLDQQFRDLQARKSEIREVVKTEYRYIREKAKTDETVTIYLDTRIPDAVGCLLAESCGEG